MKPQIYFYDPGDNAYRSNRRAWESLGQEADFPKPVELTNDELLPLRTANSHELQSDDRFACLIHWSRLNSPCETIEIWANAHSNARFIVISGGSQATPNNVPVNVLYYRQPVGALEVSGKFTVEFRKWYEMWVNDAACEWGPLDANEEPLLAFRVLCAAKRECGGKSSKEKAFGTDLTIHAPEKLADWLRPFDARDITEAAKVIGAGRFTDEATKVLQAAEKDWTDLSSAIDIFEAAYAKRQTQEP